MIFARKKTFSRKPQGHRSPDRCKYIRTRSDEVEVFQTAASEFLGNEMWIATEFVEFFNPQSNPQHAMSWTTSAHSGSPPRSCCKPNCATLMRSCSRGGALQLRSSGREFRLSPVPLKETQNRIIGLICPFLPPRVFVKCPSIRKMDGRGGGDRTHDLRLKRPLLYH